MGVIKIETIHAVKADIKPENSFKQGITAGIPIAIGYIPIAIAFGLLAKTSGIPNSTSILMSLLIFAGASQFVGVNLIALGASYWEIILTTFILNFRHFLMTASVSQKLEENISKTWLSIISFGVTDETFMVASVKNGKLSSMYVFGLNLIAFSSWNIGTWIGVFVGAGLPQSIQQSMGIALYAMFIGLLIPSIKKSRQFFTVAILSVMISSIVHWVYPLSNISTGWSIIITTIAAAFIGAVIFPKKEERIDE